MSGAIPSTVWSESGRQTRRIGGGQGKEEEESSASVSASVSASRALDEASEPREEEMAHLQERGVSQCKCMGSGVTNCQMREGEKRAGRGSWGVEWVGWCKGEQDGWIEGEAEGALVVTRE